MANYAEEIVYWYLRWNGFFLVDNLVIHRSEVTDYPSDIDVLALRLPYVYEPIGGRTEDWDESLFASFKPNLSIGLICEAKSGRYDVDKLFSKQNISYVVGRFGFVSDHESLSKPVRQHAVTIFDDRFQIGKLLFSYSDGDFAGQPFLHIQIGHCEDFIIGRIRKYPREKYADRMLFPSEALQGMIEREKHRFRMHRRRDQR